MPISAAEALRHVTQMNSRKRTQFPKELRNALPPVYVFSLYDRSFKRDCGSMGRYVIPAKRDDQEVSDPLVLQGMNPDEFDMGSDGNMGMHFVSGEDLAKAVIGLDSTTPQLDLLTTNKEWFGVFISHSNPPKKKEIEEARKKLDSMMKLLLQNGDRFAADGKISMIGAQHRKAATYLRQVREWSKEPKAMKDCPSCFSPIHPEASFCITCRTVIDPVKYAQFQPKTHEKTA